MSIIFAKTVEEIERCYAVVSELRTHLSPESFASQVRRQQADRDYQLVFLEHGGEIVAVAGFRVMEMLAWGKVCYVDDLVTKSTERSAGYGKRMMNWLAEHARSLGCTQLHLDSGVQRFDAHRFYLNSRMDIISHHFAMSL